MRPQRQGRDDPEVPSAAATAGPVEVFVRARVDVADAAVGGHDARRDEVVAREAEAATREAVATAEREAADADGGA